jgi:hypothetical protein
VGFFSRRHGGTEIGGSRAICARGWIWRGREGERESERKKEGRKEGEKERKKERKEREWMGRWRAVGGSLLFSSLLFSSLLFSSLLSSSPALRGADARLDLRASVSP